MKIYISADIEGVAGVACWEEATKGNYEYQPYVEQMNKEVRAACEGAIKAGAKEIWIKDGHDTARNLNHGFFPENVKLIKGWSGHPFDMMQELDQSFDAVLMIGYHAPGGTDKNPLAHTFSGKKIASIKINKMLASEFLINTYTAELVNVPVVFISGDEEICQQAKNFNENIQTTSTKIGKGNSVISIHPNVAVERIKEAVKVSLKNNLHICRVELPNKFFVEITYKNPSDAFKASFYPGMQQVEPTKVVFETSDYFEILRMLLFVVN